MLFIDFGLFLPRCKAKALQKLSIKCKSEKCRSKNKLTKKKKNYIASSERIKSNNLKEKTHV